MAYCHRDGDSRSCGATTIVSGQNFVFVDSHLWSVDGDGNTDVDDGYDNNDENYDKNEDNNENANVNDSNNLSISLESLGIDEGLREIMTSPKSDTSDKQKWYKTEAI